MWILLKRKSRNIGDSMRITDFWIELDTQRVLEAMDCQPDSPVYEEVLKTYGEIKDEVAALIRPSIDFEFGELSKDYGEYKKGCPVIFSVISLGKAISDYVTDKFSSGDYLSAMLADSMADNYYVQLDEEFCRILRHCCKERGVGILKRAEPPKDIPFDVINEIIEKSGTENVTLTEGMMLSPVKSCAQLFILTDENCFSPEHDCGGCSALDCKLRKMTVVKINVIHNTQKICINARKDENILEALRKNGIYINAVCGGSGKCGKCKILLNGIERLACKSYPINNCEVTVIHDDSDFLVLSPKAEEKEPDGKCGIAIDIGTTTIAMALIELDSGNIANTYTAINSQRAYGADVISRISAANEGAGTAMAELIRKDLIIGISQLCKNGKYIPEKITIAANTTMIHLLMGFSCKGLGEFPFTPVTTNKLDFTFGELSCDAPKWLFDVPVMVLPGISAYIGADIVSGIYACKLDKLDGINMLIDLGTNGEMVIAAKNRMIAASAAAGPAFEGGNITCGTGSINGAIFHVSLKDCPSFQTIGGGAPVGICGTGVIDIVSELVLTGGTDETGLLSEEFSHGVKIADAFDGKPIVFNQKDLREVQLAKAAVRTGIDLLIKRFGITVDNIDHVFVSGGLGDSLSVQNAINIGLFPDEFLSKVQAAGNTSLAGAIKVLMDKSLEAELLRIKDKCTELSLSDDPLFNDTFINNIYFRGGKSNGYY